MPTVMISSNPLLKDEWQRHDVANAGMFLYGYFNGAWPETARIYAHSVAKENDVTPGGDFAEEMTEALETIDGPLWVVVYPATGVEVAIVIGVVALIASVAAILLIPDIPGIKTPKERDAFGGSPNNKLGKRRNEARPGQRVPCPYGTIHSIPDLLSPTYTVYEDHREIEIGLYCIGEGDYDVDSENVRDGDSLIEQIEKASCHIYGPGSAPTGTGPFSGTNIAIGDPIVDPVLNVYEVGAVNGQTLEPFNSRTLYGAAKLRDIDGSYTAAVSFQFFGRMNIQHTGVSTGIISVPYTKNQEYVLDRMVIGDRLFLFIDTAFMPASGATFPNLQTSTTEPFTNAVTVTGITTSAAPHDETHMDVAISIPAALSAQWALVPAYVAALVDLQTFAGGFDAEYAELTPLTHLFTGPFFVDREHPPGSQDQHILVNFLAPLGLYTDDGTNILKESIVMGVEVAPCDSLGAITGAWEVFTDTLQGSDVTDGPRALTMRFEPTFSGRFLIRARRVGNRRRRMELPFYVETENYPKGGGGGQLAFTGRMVDEIRWMNAYSMSKPPNISFGNITMVHTRTVATQGVARLQERELNILCTRKILTWNGSIFTGPAVANADAENVLFSIMKDPNVGNRLDSEIDFVGIVAACEEVREYFNDSNTGDTATLVSYTFDDFNTSFEESAISIANLAFLTIYRQGNVIKAKPEIATDDAVCAFNHRNIIPGSQKITHTFGPPTENDSVEVDYTDPYDDALTTVRVPLLGTFFSPRTLRVVGVRTRRQALWHAYRAFFKMKHQRQALEMECTQEAGSLIVKDRMLVADITRLTKQSGNVVSVTGLNLRLSQPPVIDPAKNYTIFLQLIDATVEGIPVTAGAGAFDVTLGSAPSLTLVTDPNLGVPTVYTLVQDDDAMPFAYMVSEQSAQSNMVFNISGVNYSNMYYFGDSLNMWMVNNQGQPFDISPQEYSFLVADHTVPVVVEPTRGNMFDFDGANSLNVDFTRFSDIISLTRGYTFSAWIKHNSTPAFGYSGIAQTTNDSTTLFGFFDNDLAAGHNGVLQVQATCSTGVLHMIGVTWDPSGGRLAIFLDGELVDVATGVAAPTVPLAMVYGKQYDGLADSISRWKRCFSDRAMMELYLKTKIL